MKQTKLWMLHVALLCLVLGGCTANQKTDQKTDYVSVKTIRADASTHVVGKNYMGTIEEEDKIVNFIPLSIKTSIVSSSIAVSASHIPSGFLPKRYSKSLIPQIV